MRIRPGGAGLGTHIHPNVDERFTVLNGKIDYMLGDESGKRATFVSINFPVQRLIPRFVPFLYDSAVVAKSEAPTGNWKLAR